MKKYYEFRKESLAKKIEKCDKVLGLESYYTNAMQGISKMDKGPTRTYGIKEAAFLERQLVKASVEKIDLQKTLKKIEQKLGIVAQPQPALI